MFESGDFVKEIASGEIRTITGIGPGFFPDSTWKRWSFYQDAKSRCSRTRGKGPKAKAGTRVRPLAWNHGLKRS